MIFVHPWTCLLWALLVLMVPLKWLLAAVVAAVVHEVCHVVPGLILGGKIHGLQIRSGGLVIDMTFPGKLQELMATVCGPVGSLLLLYVGNRMPELAICGLFHGVYNLIPVYPLDGGRILSCILEIFCPVVRGRVMGILEGCVFLTFMLLCIFAAWKQNWGIWPAVACIGMICRLRAGKSPCKREQIKVQ